MHHEYIIGASSINSNVYFKAVGGGGHTVVTGGARSSGEANKR